jgi:hypothetical protein
MLVTAHGGQLTLTSQVGVGTQVTVTLPAADRPASLGDRLGSLAAHLPHATSRH